MPYKATINTDKDEWTDYLDLCKSLGTTGSKEVRKFIEAFKRGEIYSHKNLKPDLKKGSLTKFENTLIVDKVLDNLKKDKVWVNSIKTEVKTEVMKSFTTFAEGIKTDIKTEITEDLNSVIQEKMKSIEKDIETDMKTVKTNLLEPINSLKKTIQTQPPQENSTETTSNPPEVLENWARKAYQDKEVAEIEKLNKSTVVRLRNRKKGGADKTFWNRWEISTLNPTRWWRVQVGESTQKEKNLVKN